MFEDEDGTPPSEPAPAVVLPTLGDPAGASGGPGASPVGWRTRSKVVGALASVVVLAVAVIVPMELSGIASVSGAVKGVFARPTVRLVLTERGTPELHGYAVAVTISNPSGAAVSAPRAKDSYEVSVLHDGSDLADVMVTHTAIYLRLDVNAIDSLAHQQSGTGSLRHFLEHAAKERRQLSFLRVVANGGWVGLDLNQLKQYLSKAVGELGSSGGITDAKSSRVRSALTLSLAQAWDAWASLHVQSSTGGVTEYSIKLPVRQFLLTFAKDFENRIKATFHGLKASFPAINRALGRIPAKLRLPIDLWVTNGTLTKVEVTYHGITLDVAISHPSALPAAPKGVTYVTIAELKAFVRYLEHPSVIAAGAAAAESNVQTAFIGAETYYTSNNQSFAGLTSPSPNNVRRLDTGLTWLPAGKVPRSPNDVSSEVGASGTSVVLTTYDPSSRSCAGIVGLLAPPAHPVLGLRRAGTYFFLLRHVTAAACEVTHLTHVKVSTQGFPGMATSAGASGISSILGGIGSVGSSGVAAGTGGFASGSLGSGIGISSVASSGTSPGA